ncbi:hypothetical protein PHSY_000071 [Pseudozyma hubeiensis SY62]|uniref:Uncharacterized protein n=1 Tax=Pseudozyma hubeiensis (strain SY62) TaxID=1305764 RepID=R9NVT0_PSEHS|nr:hypothetical protein PHSY_000071 [Pseudozyma hubeiensis SY62]GAC92517.1 hypothetical protein PHSY_000071 [Pseudozyma hubeiensis SY62]
MGSSSAWTIRRRRDERTNVKNENRKKLVQEKQAPKIPPPRQRRKFASKITEVQQEEATAKKTPHCSRTRRGSNITSPPLPIEHLNTAAAEDSGRHALPDYQIRRLEAPSRSEIDIAELPCECRLYAATEHIQ